MTCEVFTIRVTNYCGDEDDLRAVLIIGPYPAVEARNADMARFAALPGVYGNAAFGPSRIPATPATSDECVHPDKLADVRDCEDLMLRLYGLDDVAARLASGNHLDQDALW